MCDNKSEVVIALYHAEDWCGPCKQFKPIWDNFVDKIRNNPDYKYIKVDCSQTNDDGTCKKINDKSKDISDKLYDKITNYHVNGFPTVMLFVGDSEPIEFCGNRDINTLYEFIESKGKKHHKKSKSGGSIAENAFEEYQEEEDNDNFDQCGGGKCDLKGGRKVKDEKYYEMKYYKYKAKYIELKSRLN